MALLHKIYFKYITHQAKISHISMSFQKNFKFWHTISINRQRYRLSLWIIPEKCLKGLSGKTPLFSDSVSDGSHQSHYSNRGSSTGLIRQAIGWSTPMTDIKHSTAGDPICPSFMDFKDLWPGVHKIRFGIENNPHSSKSQTYDISENEHNYFDFPTMAKTYTR